MFKVLNRKRKQLDILENPISPVITTELGGIGELTFSVPSTYKHLELEGYIQVEDGDEYVIKEIVTHGTNREIYCMLNVEEIVGMAWSTFISKDKDVYTTAIQILNGTGWRVENKSTTKETRNLYGTATNSYNLLQLMCTVFNVEFTFDTYNKVVRIVDRVGNECGTYFINDLNLKQLNIDTHTHKLITRVIPLGKDGLQITSVNGGRNYLENKTYCDKTIYGIWQSDKHDDPAKLKADAQRFLDEMAIPYETYEVLVDDLYALQGYTEFKYDLGDVVTIIDGVTETKIKQRVIKRTYNLQEPDKDTINIANKDQSFEDYYKRLQTIADMTESVIGSDGTISGGNLTDGSVTGDKLDTDIITSDHIQAGSITADHIQANQIFTEHLVAGSITAELIQANTIDTHHLKANTIQSGHIQSNSIDTNHLKANIINAGHIQSGSITAGSGIIGDGAIGNAQISSIDAGKINAGTIDTSRVTVSGANGHLRLKGNRMQVFDGVGNQANERVSVGDVNGDGSKFGLLVRGKDGETVIFDENGVTNAGITDGSITNDKISDDANIEGYKLNINSVINSINEDGTEVIQGTKIEIDGTNLGVTLSEMQLQQNENAESISQAQSQITANTNAISLKVDEQVYTSDKEAMTSTLEKHTSDISAMKGQIALKVEQTDIENAKNELGEVIDSKIESAKSEIKVTTDKISQSVSNVETNITSIDNKADTAIATADNAKDTANQAKSEVQETKTKLASIETSLDGITSSVSHIEDTTTMLEGQVASQETRLTLAEQKITPSAITSVVQSANFVQDMNGKINTNTSNISKVEQTANSITNRVEALDGKYTEIKQTVDSIDMTGKVSFSDLSISGKTTIHGGNIKTDTLAVSSLKANNTNPILKLFPQSDGTYCSLDATKLYESGGKGSWIRLKWNSKNYWYIGENSAGVYLNNSTDETNGEYGTRFWISTTHARFNVNKLMIGTGDCRIDTDGGAIRIYTTPDGGLDRGIRINNKSGRLEVRQSDLMFTNVDNGTYKTVAWSDHTHSNYASSSHTHSNYASSSHTHSNYASSSHTHDKVSYNSTKVDCYNGYIVFDAGSAYFRMDNGSNHGGAYKFYPNAGGIDLGSNYSTNNRWRYIFSQNALNTSDVKCKEDIHYLDDNIARFGRNNTPFLDFIKNNFRPATYMYKAMREEEGHVDADRQIGFIANDIIDTEVGQTFLYNFGTEEETDIMYSPTGYTTVVAKALQEEIKVREALENKCADLEDRLAKIEKLIGGM